LSSGARRCARYGYNRVLSGYSIVVNLLALETSTELCSVALWRDGRLDALDAGAGARNSEALLPMVDALLAAQGVTRSDLHGIAFGAGPGAFTGLRVACGVAQGIAFGCDLRVAAVGTLEALAEAAQAPRIICCLDARMGEIYHAAYEKDGARWREVSAPGLYKPAAAPSLPGDGWQGCGSGFAVFGAALAAVYGAQLDKVIEGVVPHALQIATLAATVFERGEALAAEHAAPLYVRNKVALKVEER